MTNDIVAIIAGLVSIIAVVVTLITASTSAKSTALAELQKVVEALQKRMGEQDADILSLKKELAKERKLRMMYENYIQALILKMREKQIEPPAISAYVTDEDDWAKV